MPTTRSGNRGDTASSPASVKSVSGGKRKADAASPAAKATKRGRPAKEQTTIEETLPLDNGDENVHNKEKSDIAKPNGHDKQNGEDVEMSGAIDDGKKDESEKKGDEKTDAQANGEDTTKSNVTNGENAKIDESTAKQDESKAEPAKKDESNAFDQVKAEAGEAGKTTKDEPKQEEPAPTANGDALKEDKARAEAQPSNILEKGIIYFFTRGRVGTEHPESVQDLQRSFFVLRPLPAGAKIADGSFPDTSTNRLFALPKKVWPKSGKDKFMVFVEKAKVDMKTLKDEFFGGSEYSTKTTGTQQTPPVTPIGEGVYAITTTGGGQGTTHFVYMLTIPDTPGDVQNDVGLASKGSFAISLKNPEAPGPANAALPQKPDWPKEFIEEFRGRGWMPPHPKHLDYANAQMLLIGEDFESSNNLEPKSKDEQDDKKITPEEELQKLEDEDEHRVEALSGDNAVFVDLGISQKEYPKVKTTW